eukprot:RCo052240
MNAVDEAWCPATDELIPESSSAALPLPCCSLCPPENPVVSLEAPLQLCRAAATPTPRPFKPPPTIAHPFPEPQPRHWNSPGGSGSGIGVMNPLPSSDPLPGKVPGLPPAGFLASPSPPSTRRTFPSPNPPPPALPGDDGAAPPQSQPQPQPPTRPPHANFGTYPPLTPIAMVARAYVAIPSVPAPMPYSVGSNASAQSQERIRRSKSHDGRVRIPVAVPGFAVATPPRAGSAQAPPQGRGVVRYLTPVFLSCPAAVAGAPPGSGRAASGVPKAD